ncbi:MAG TPA: NAD(P)-dependent oxidoreductase [Tissierellaceae bacterium]|nr:NAD(P)-dependent oxidoreductase [Tissierellaceae bacterium]
MKKRVFISGLTGTMGRASLTHLMTHKDKLDIVTIVRPSKKNRKTINELKDHNIDVIWGDLTNYEDVKKAIGNVDYILHVAAFVSPEADYEPEKAWDINVGSTENILKAIDELGLYNVKLVYIGSVAQTGDRLPPIHWGRVGDPLKPSLYDNYAVTKIAAERKIIESGLKYWVSLRQTGILHYGLLEIMDGIMFHQPLNNVLEWVTEDDSGRLLANICIKDLPDEFWKNIYNIGGGDSFRKTNYEFMSMTLKAAGVKDLEKIFEPNWFATRNFHGQYYLDSDKLNEYLDFRKENMEDFMTRLKENMKFPVTALKYLPNFFIKNFIMKTIVKSHSGPLGWIKSKDRGRTKAFFGSLKKRGNIKEWENFSIDDDYSKKLVLNHGYNEEKDENLLALEDMREVAKFRGGECLSHSMTEGDLETKLKWKCAFSHEFIASPRLILKGGHWCEECEAPPWNFDEIARKNPFFRQVWKVK